MKYFIYITRPQLQIVRSLHHHFRLIFISQLNLSKRSSDQSYWVHLVVHNPKMLRFSSFISSSMLQLKLITLSATTNNLIKSNLSSNQQKLCRNKWMLFTRVSRRQSRVFVHRPYCFFLFFFFKESRVHCILIKINFHSIHRDRCDVGGLWLTNVATVTSTKGCFR